MKRVYLTILVFANIFIISCNKTEYVDKIIEKEYSWKKDNRIQFENDIVLNMHTNKDFLFTLSPFYFTSIAAAGSHPNNTPLEQLNLQHFNSLEIKNKYPISNDMFILINSNNSAEVTLYSTSDPVNYINGIYQYQNPIKINMKAIDKYFYGFDLSNYTMNECAVIGEKGFCLIPYQIKPYNQIFNKYLLIKTYKKKFSMHGKEFTFIDTIYTKNFLAPMPNYSQGIVATTFDKDMFLIGTILGGEYVDTLGKTGFFDETKRFYKFFRNDRILYSFAWYSNGTGLFKSSDSKNWELINNVESGVILLNFHALNDTLLLGSYHDQLFRYKILNDGYDKIELENDGLENKLITSASIFKDSLVYVSTLSGLYYKPLKSLLKVKKAESTGSN